MASSAIRFPRTGYYLVRLGRPVLMDAASERFMVPYQFEDGGWFITSVWYPAAHGLGDRPRRSEHFNLAAGLRAEERLLGREGEVAGRRVTVKVYCETQPDGTEARRDQFFPPRRV